MPPSLQTAEPRPSWQVASALGVTQIFSFGSSYYLHGVLGSPMRAETGWSLEFLAMAQTAGMLVAGLVSPAVGRAIQGRGGLAPLTLGFSMLAAGLVIIALSPGQPVFLLGWLVLGVGMGSALYDSVFSALGRLYGLSARKPITTVTLWGGFASTVCWPLSAALLDIMSWRGVCIVFAAIHILICLPLLRWSVPSQEHAALLSEEQGGNAISSDNGSLFYLLVAVTVACGMAMTVVYVHLIEILQARGLALAAAVSFGALIGPSQVAARAIDMLVGVRHHPIWTLLASLGLIASGISLFAAGVPVTGLAIILFSAGNGIFSIARGALPLALFGPRLYPVIMGRLARPLFLAQAMSPALGAIMIARLGVDVTLWILALACVANCLAGIGLYSMMRRG